MSYICTSPLSVPNKMPKTEFSFQRIQCDVLVIGGAITALVAALEARKSVENVVMVCKKKVGRSGNTIVSGAAFSVYVPSPENPDSVEQHLKDTLEAGAGINDPVLARILTEEGGPKVLSLEKYGVRLLRSDGSLVRRIPPGHSRARSIPTDLRQYAHNTRGLSITIPLVELAMKRGIQMLIHTQIHKILVREGIVCGALAMDARMGTQILISAKAVVLASGGGGRLFEHSNNTLDMTGDSFALALEAGAALRDMEFIQFYPTRGISPVRANISSPLFGEGAVLRNVSGERFMLRYDIKADMATRDVMSRAICSEVLAGRGVEGGVYIDLSAVHRTTLELKFPTTLKLLQAHGIDANKQWLVVSPAAHFIMGGAWIDSCCMTGIAGLFAAGEAAGGVHGANRLAGNALTETVVFGIKAGHGAAAYTRRSKGVPETIISGLEVPGIRRGSATVAEVKSRFRRALWNCAGLVRTENGLKQGRVEIQGCEEAMYFCKVEGAADKAAYLEVSRMIQVGKVIIEASLSRQESRGAHHRSDYPDRDDTKWRGSSCTKKSGDNLEVRFVPLARAKD